jgi:hypothetical protein
MQLGCRGHREWTGADLQGTTGMPRSRLTPGMYQRRVLPPGGWIQVMRGVGA